jgi:hypothetical protein
MDFISLESLAIEDTLVSILIRFAVNLTVLFVLIRLIYYRFTKKEEFVFSYFLLGIIINLICSLLGTVDIQIGMALGLFAIFAILRFRTVTFTVKEMTYIFIVIGVSVINSQANIPPPFIGAVVVNSIIVIATLILELFLLNNSLNSYTIKYNKADLLKPDRESELLRDLSIITGYKVVKVTINEFDTTKGNSELIVWFKEKYKQEDRPAELTVPGNVPL